MKNVENYISKFLSSLAQDFIEDLPRPARTPNSTSFLSSLAQDFIEDKEQQALALSLESIPDFSSSGLH